ncbi:hypothetical protein ACFO9E_08855 [Streptomyces maoxianensis]|uniref:GNAT family N-acetyltransferase n=1 Tax=Streptomyces maoxianensis TaxID=1459942 RepID=A0ABV9G4B4_9ACTN
MLRHACCATPAAPRLLRHACGVYAARGRDTIGPAVDGGNETGALRLYEAHGMACHFAVDTWVVTVPTGTAAGPDGR